MKLIVLRPFKDRFQDFKMFEPGDEYTTVTSEHTKRLLKLKFIEAQKPKPKKPKKEKGDGS